MEYMIGTMVGSLLPGDPAMNSALGILLVGGLLSALGKIQQAVVSWLHRFRSRPSGSSVLVMPGDPLHVPLQKALLEKVPEAFVQVRLDSSQGHPEMRVVTSSLKEESFELRLSETSTVRVSVGRHPDDLLAKDPLLLGSNAKSFSGRARRWFERLVLLGRRIVESGLTSESHPSSTKKDGKDRDLADPSLEFSSPSLGVCELKEQLVAFSRGSCDGNQKLKLFRLTRSAPGKTKKKDSVAEMRWNSQPLVCSKNFGNTPMSDGVERALYDDFRKFLKSQAAYRLRGLSWKRGYLLHGPPGSGKSSCIRAMAVEGGLDVFLLDMQLVQNNAELALALAQIGGLSNQRPHLLVLEDFDRCSLVTKYAELNDEEDVPKDEASPEDDPEDMRCDTPVLGDVAKSTSSRNRRRYYPPGSKSSVTLDALLQEMEGVVEHVGRVTILTANKPSSLQAVDPTGALFRVGRIDRQIRVGLCTRKQVERILRMYFAVENSDAASRLPPMTDRFRPRTLSPAQLIDLLRGPVSSLEEACLFLKGEPSDPKLLCYFSQPKPPTAPPRLSNGKESRSADSLRPPSSKNATSQDDDGDGDDEDEDSKTHRQRRLDALTREIKAAKATIRKAATQRKKLVEFMTKLQAAEERETCFLETRQDDFLRLQLAMEKVGVKSRLDRPPAKTLSTPAPE